MKMSLIWNGISFSYKRMGTKIRFKEEAKGNSETAYCLLWMNLIMVRLCIVFMIVEIFGFFVLFVVVAMITLPLFSILFSFSHSAEVTLQENVATAQGGKRSPCRR